MTNYWDQAKECMNVQQKKELQGERLVQTIQRVYENVPYYREKMQQAGVTPADIHGVEDLAKLPFTEKKDLRNNYPFNSFAVPMKEVVRVHASSGTTGKQTVVGYTKKDLDVWADLIARCLYTAGVRDTDIVHVAFGYGLFTGGLGVHYGIEALGATVVPASGGNTSRQLQLMVDFGATVLACTPSYALYLADEIQKQGLRDQLKLRIGIFGAEPWSEEMRQQIEEKLGIKAYDIYGLSEVMGPGVAIECPEYTGMHVNDDCFIVEVIDPETGEVLPEGSTGELVFTCLQKEALPLIRYRTHDLTRLEVGPCACGRTTPRMQKVKGRSDDMMIIRGVNVFPSQIESALLQYPEIAAHYVIYIDRSNNTDSIEVHVELKPELFADVVGKITQLEKKISQDVDSAIGIKAKIRLVEPNTLPRSEGKACRIIDRRQIFAPGE